MQTHEEWLHKSKSDLCAAKTLFESNNNLILDAAVYHTQQCAEKSFKAYLDYRKHKIEKTHNLVVLVGFCGSYDDTFKTLVEISAILTPYGFKFRYPDDILLPERIDVEKAINYSEKILQFVLDKIEELESGQQKIFE